MSYARFTPMIEDARAHPALWRLVAGTVTAAAVMALWAAAISALALWSGLVDPAGTEAAGMAALASTPGGVILLLGIVGGLGLGAIAAARLWHRRRVGSLTGRGPRTLHDFAVAATASAAVFAASAALSYPLSEPVMRNLEPARWLAWLPFALLVLVVQTGSEELFFRGYMQSQLAARFRARAAWVYGPAVLFGLAHFSPGLPLPAAMTYVGAAFLFGVLAADLTARTGSIGAAWGFHFTNNALGILIVSTDGALTGLGLYRTTTALEEAIAPSPWLLMDIAALALAWAAIRRLLRV